MRESVAESAHEDCVRKLVKEFGAEKEDEIRKVYLTRRHNLEKGAKILLYTAILTYSSAREELQVRYARSA